MPGADSISFDRIFGSFGLVDLLDVVIGAAVLYSLLVWFRRSRAAFVLIGMLIVGFIYLAARQFGLKLTTGLLQGFFAVFLIAVVVIFQEEIRQFFERIASRSLIRHRLGRRAGQAAIGPTEVLVRTLGVLARRRIGALVVLRGKTPVDRHLDGGIPLGGQLSPEILISIFDPNTPGHDGASLVDGDRIVRFGCRLPLSSNTARLAGMGTRHAAGLGLSEVTDALVLVVSEERGEITAAANGDWIDVREPGALHALVAAHLGQAEPATGVGRTLRSLVLRNGREKLLAVGLALVLWFFLVHEAAPAYRTVWVPVRVALHDPGLGLASSRPERVEVIVSGARSAFYFFDPSDVRLNVRLPDAAPGRMVRSLGPSDFALPDGLRVETVRPESLELELVANGGGGGTG